MRVLAEKNRIWVAVGVIVVVVLVLGAYLARRGAKVELGRSFEIQLGTEPVTLDFSLAEDGVSFQVLAAMMEGLFVYDSSNRLKAAIADRCDSSEAGKKWTCVLRGRLWSDGAPVRARDFAYAIRRALDPATASKLADLLFVIRGAEEFKKGTERDFASVGVRVISDDRIEFDLETPVSYFPHLLALPITFPQREDVVSAAGASWPEKTPVTGPYRIRRWIRDQRVELERNPQYDLFSREAPEGVTFRFVSEEAAALSLYENHRLDLLFKVPSLDVQRLRERGVVKEFPYFATYYIAFDQRQKPWDDVRARRAVAHAIHRKLIVDALASQHLAASSWIPHGIPGFEDSIGVKSDPESAAAAWAKSRARDQKNVVFGYDSGARNQTVAERIQSDLKEYLGLELKLQMRDWKTHIRDLGNHPAPLFRFGWLSPFVDPYASLMPFASNSPNNYTGWSSSRYDWLLSQIQRLSPVDPARKNLLDSAQRLLLEDDVVVVPIFHYMQTVVVSQRVRSLQINGLGLIDYMGVRLAW